MSLNKIPFLKFGGSMILAAVVVATAIGAGIAALGTGSQIPLFAPINPLNAAEYAGTATLLQSGKVLIAGGESSGTETNAAEIYDPATGIFSTTGNLHTARFGHTAVLLADGTVVIAGGANASGVIASFEIYNPTTGVFTVDRHRAFEHGARFPHGNRAR